MINTLSKGIGAALAVCALAAPPVAAQSTSSFRQALSSVPIGSVAFDRPYVELEFGDPEAALNIVDLRNEAGLPAQDPYVAHLSALPLMFQQSLVLVERDAIIAALGITPFDLGASLTLSAPPNRLATVELAAEPLAALHAAMDASDSVTMEQRGGADVAWVGSQDYAINLDLRDTTNPFGGMLGLSGRYLFTETGIAWSPGWPAIEAVASGGAPLATDPRLAAIVDVLDAANADMGSVLRYANGVVADPSQIPAFAQANLGTAAIALNALMTFDLATPESNIGLMVLTFEPETDVTALTATAQSVFAEGLSVSARRPYSVIFPDGTTVTAHPGDVPAISIMSSAAAEEDMLPNRPANRLTTLLISGDLQYILNP
ncbi:hypothetical protein [Gymnodinialimonas hymeniacidonis]|uniref:hypothetical protein n=1 Tax=Gymnodinialimonas hymeniacidonis TaxID=3126508 RepID=UPI0034C6AAAE